MQLPDYCNKLIKIYFSIRRIVTKETTLNVNLNEQTKNVKNTKVWAEPGQSVFLIKLGMCVTGKSPANDDSILAEIKDTSASHEMCEQITTCINISRNPSVETMRQIFYSMLNKFGGIAA